LYEYLKQSAQALELLVCAESLEWIKSILSELIYERV